MRVYLDNCCFNRPFDDQSQLRIRLETEAKLAIQDQIKAGELELVWSYMLDFENAANPFAERKSNIADWRDLATYDVAASDELLAIANNLRTLGCKTKDCLHLASALTSDCKFFFTTDDGILNKRSQITNLQILNPVDFATKTTHDN